ncbi:Similar to Jazf1: Juxtaposed with another zinc finger protein 1 (Mus musculus) [Cotesia congregata]|uniref:Similar to Jazf1: Juxtaposed with another zinc finger protein 1 (Mus musculus) n=1 Tax=Cotesia congregata TaxID=51543 RepID=A0A8J2MJT4_COTCN|nr:Similar to Jazf1: Juxtaposed with another zinc finger protein 1 (Mus musculus) [Cotesia congregata]
MAVFMLNVCKFNACGLTFKSLGHLIQHIEETHIDYDPLVVEQFEQQQPQCIPLSYALRFLTDSTREKEKTLTRTKSTTEDSNDSWATSEEFSSDYILRYGSRVVGQTIINQNNNNTDKPFVCPVPGCKKRYKNVNGIKYHSKNGHRDNGKVRKAFKCSCGKSYKTTYGLKNHAAIQHTCSASGLQIKLTNKSLIKTANEFDNLSSINAGNSSGDTKISLKVSSLSSSTSSSKTKVSAIEDHGYIKSEFIECDDDLGILTPASTPPLSVQGSIKSEQQQFIVNGRNLHKYFASTPKGNTQRRQVKNEY